MPALTMQLIAVQGQRTAKGAVTKALSECHLEQGCHAQASARGQVQQQLAAVGHTMARSSFTQCRTRSSESLSVMSYT
jgi:hypothetical protein